MYGHKNIKKRAINVILKIFFYAKPLIYDLTRADVLLLSMTVHEQRR